MKIKTYVITGASSGIGKTLTEKLAGDNIIFAGYRNSKYEALLKNVSSSVYPFYIDYSKPETIKPAADYILSNCDKIDTLVNIAGCVVAGPVDKIAPEELRNQFNVNVFGHIELTQNLLPALENGKIINVSSMASYGIFPFVAPYCASKRALDMLFNSLLVENKKNIKVVSIKPGVISTPLWRKSVDENSKYFDNFREYADEMKYVIANAKKNEKCGLSADKVVNVILKADKSKKPKLSYTVGCDALFAKWISKLPQSLVNRLIKTGIRLKTSRSK